MESGPFHCPLPYLMTDRKSGAQSGEVNEGACRDVQRNTLTSRTLVWRYGEVRRCTPGFL